MPVLETVNQGEQDVLLRISPVTAKGNPAEIEAGTLAVTIDSGDATSEPGADGTSVKIVTAGVGKVTGTITGDADLGEGVVSITDTFEIDVVSPQATNLGVTAEVVEKVV